MTQPILRSEVPGLRSMLPLLALLIVVSGCARPDWIQRTLVTVDVTGTWEGSSANTGAFLLSLEQQGAQVKGSMRVSGGSKCWDVSIAGPIQGTVAGDVLELTFKQANAAFSGHMTVTGDEMSGGGSGGRCGPFTLTLRRVTASSSPSVPKP